MKWIKFLHLILTMTLTGGMIASYYYVSKSVKTRLDYFITFTLRYALLLDCVLFLPIILISFATGTSLIMMLNIPITTPWIVAAYMLLIFALINWMLSFMIKGFNYSFQPYENNQKFRFLGLYHVVNLLFIACMIVIVHDAVRKQTFLWYGYLN